MKKSLIFAMSVITLFLFSQKVEAAAYRAISPEEQEALISDEPFAELNPDDKVLQLPDGTFLNGEATAYYNENDLDSGVELNSETNPNSITVENARELIEEGYTENLNPRLTRGVTPEFKVIKLGTNAYAQRWVDMVPGWHSLPAVYYAAPNTGGPYLLFSTGNDSALVGSAQQATSSFNGRMAGTVLARDSSRYFAGTNTIYTYFDRVMSNVHGVGKQFLKVINK